MVDHDECPSCGARMQPALVGDAVPPDVDTGPLLADATVRLVCLTCTPDQTKPG